MSDPVSDAVEPTAAKPVARAGRSARGSPVGACKPAWLHVLHVSERQRLAAFVGSTPAMRAFRQNGCSPPPPPLRGGKGPKSYSPP